VRGTLYGIAPSHPTHAARLMLEHKGIEHRVIDVPPGTHAAALRLLGFRRGTVPALKLDGRRVQGSRAISRALDEAQPEPRLFPADPQRRIAVEEAERWGEQILQNLPRLLTRWLTLYRSDMRRHMARETGIPFPRIAATVNTPVAWHFARKVGANDDELVRRTLLSVPQQLDRVEELIAEGTLGADRNAADFQIAPTVRCLLTFEDFAPLIEDRRAARYALEILPDYPTKVPAGMLPAEWLAELRARARS
jgi:glutathione S-transferase